MDRIRVNERRLSSIFMELLRIDSPSRHEGQVAAYVRRWCSTNVPEAVVLEDNSQVDTGSETGNLIIKIPGNTEAPSFFFNAHMDTVEPGRDVKPIIEDGVFRSDGSTILGGDDKAAIAIMLETVLCMREHQVSHGPFELLLTTCEEIGLLGAKALDETLVEARAGIALDTEDPDSVINRAPAAVRFKVTVHGLAAHAGLDPEKGINAIRVAAKAVSTAPQGRIDKETTCNIGTIKGGTATNIVPDLAEVDGEVRSHREERLREIQDEMLKCFYKTAELSRKQTSGRYPYVSATVEDDYPLMHVSEDHPVVKSVQQAGRNLGRSIRIEMTGGGSDANILNEKGLATLIAGIGMQKVHTTEEFIRLDDMVKSCMMVIEVLRTWRKTCH